MTHPKKGCATLCSMWPNDDDDDHYDDEYLKITLTLVVYDEDTNDYALLGRGTAEAGKDLTSEVS